MKLRANIRRVTGKTKHSIGGVVNGELVEIERLPTAAWVLIEQDGSSFALIRYSKSGEFAGDTSHETLEEAKHQASFEYEILESDWKSLPD